MPENRAAPERLTNSPRATEAAERRRRAWQQIRLWGDPVLRSKARAVDEFGPLVHREVARLSEVMRDAPGRGLAAPQIGSLRRIAVYQMGDVPGEEPVRVLVNPTIVESSPEREMFVEGCLSIPGIFVGVERSSRVVVQAQDPDGSSFVVEGEGLHASVLQHEIDHLSGVLLSDRLDRKNRRAFMRAVRSAAAAGWPEEMEILVGSTSDSDEQDNPGVG